MGVCTVMVETAGLMHVLSPLGETDRSADLFTTKHSSPSSSWPDLQKLIPNFFLLWHTLCCFQGMRTAAKLNIRSQSVKFFLRAEWNQSYFNLTWGFWISCITLSQKGTYVSLVLSFHVLSSSSSSVHWCSLHPPLLVCSGARTWPKSQLPSYLKNFRPQPSPHLTKTRRSPLHERVHGSSFHNAA